MTDSAPPRARDFALRDLGSLDDQALRVFLQPGEAGLSPRLLGRAMQNEHPGLRSRVLDALSPEARDEYVAAEQKPASRAEVEEAQRAVVSHLFWPLLYWHDPCAYEELVAGERIHPRILDALDLEGRTVCDVGAGAGRFTLFAARRAARVVAVDGMPPLLGRLELLVREQGLANVEVRRGSFDALPLEDGSVDVAVACSSLTSQAPWGGEAALAELDRIVRDGGEIAVIWPDRPEWFRERGFVHLSAPGNDSLFFADPETAERICRDFYSDVAAAWVVEHRASAVPFRALGIAPPNDACLRVVRKRRP
ncbi:MAG: methyltransferase domain-containing protein [Candidatus Dormibacteria bacterium]